MPPAFGRFLRENAFIVAAVLLPLVVIAFFLVSTAVPRWTVPAPQYDLVIKAGAPYNQAPPLMVDFFVRNDRVEAHVRPVPPNGYAQRSSLFLFDHATGRLDEVRVELPDTVDAPRDIPVAALAERRVTISTEAPDGYRLEIRPNRGPGLVGELFGMNRYGQGVTLVNGGRVVALTPPAPHQYLGPVSAVGWIVPEGR